MQKNLAITFLSGPIDVAYRREGGRWLCAAMQFSIIGTGKTQAAAFQEMQELVNEYFEAVIESREPVKLFNPADPEEWKGRPIKRYLVAIIYVRKQPDLANLKRRISARDLPSLRNRIVSTNLVASDQIPSLAA